LGRHEKSKIASGGTFVKIIWGGIVLLGLWLSGATAAPVAILTLSDSINPGTGGYLIRGIEQAEKDGAPFLILQLDTPGGLLETTREIVQKMLNAKLPVVVFIGPRGAHAGSAGALISFAADVVAMAPGTNIGAAHPVAPGVGMDKATQEKIVNDAAAFAESLARAKGRNTDWVGKAVKQGASISSEEALKQGVVDFRAENLADLLKKLKGRKLNVEKAGVSFLPDADLFTQRVPLSWKEWLIAFFADPNLAYLMLSFAGLCLWVELSHPGLVLPAVVGVLCLILSLLSFQMLPVSFGALGLIILGMSLLISELFVPAYGVLGLGGVVLFVLGSLFLIDSEMPEFQIPLRLILPTATVLVTVALSLGGLVLNSRKAKIRSGLESMVGEYGEVRDAISKQPGKILLQGELWSAISQTGDSLAKGEIVVVAEVRNMLLVVGRAQNA
jgi:membrane-bound serine protease (ClpP class)